jgi:hypothetical protein
LKESWYDAFNHLEVNSSLQAFVDTLKILLEKLDSYGISGSTNSWFQSHLANQQQFAEINHSDARNIVVNRYRYSSMNIHGVPQGSVLGPLLFLSYINYLALNTHGANLVMFTDYINLPIADTVVCVVQNKVDRVIS